MQKILCVGLDARLLYTRNLVLQQTGAEVYSAKVEPALALLEAQYFDVLVLCHSLAEQDLDRVCRTASLFWPVTRLLLMRDADAPTSARCFHVTGCSSQLSPDMLLKQVENLLQSATPNVVRVARVLQFPTPAKRRNIS